MVEYISFRKVLFVVFFYNCSLVLIFKLMRNIITKLFLFLLSIIFLFSDILYAQMPEWTWAKKISGPTSENSRCIATDAQGNIFIAGVFKSDYLNFGPVSVPHHVSASGLSNDDIFIAKYDPNGNVLWAQGFGGPYYELVYDIATDAQGNVYLAGSFGSQSLFLGNIELINSNLMVEGSPDAFLAKLSPSGTVLWAKSFGGNTTDQGDNIEQCFSVAVDAENNVAVVGFFTSPQMTIPPATLTKSGLKDAFVAKFTGSGTLLWAKSFGGNFFDDASSCQFDKLGHLYVAGTFTSSVFNLSGQTLTNSMANSNDFYLCKLDGNGNVLWARKGDGTGQEFAGEIALSPDGNLCVVGSYSSYTLSFDNATIGGFGNGDAFVVKYDANGQALWAKGIGDVQDEWGTAITCDTLGNIYCTGYFASGSMYFGENIGYIYNQGGYDIFLVKIKPNGEFGWAKGIGTNEEDRSAALAYSPAGSIVLTGYFSGSSLNLGNFNLPNTPNEFNLALPEIFLASFPAAAPVKIDVPTKFLIKLFPNPATNECVIVSNTSLNGTVIRIYDYQGKIVYAYQIQDNGFFRFSTRDIPTGIYHVNLQLPSGQAHYQRLSVKH